MSAMRTPYLKGRFVQATYTFLFENLSTVAKILSLIINIILGSMVKTVGISGSIRTSYAYSDELDDPTSELFERYAASVESEMTSIMMQSASVDSISTRVTSFEAAETGRRKRQAKVEFRGLLL